MKLIVQIKFGSHLYGTSTPQSDLDVKGVYLPSARDVLLQQIRPMISDSRPKEHGEKNTADDIDREAYSLQRYLELLAQGQTVALDMLFAPDWAMMQPPDQA
jgi:predicted nucleotidyltransferase